MIAHSKPLIEQADCVAVGATLDSGMIAAGGKVREFEEQVARFHGGAGCVALGSGTAALALALTALRVGAGDEVVLPTYVCRSVAVAVKAVGATPVLCDIGERWTMIPVNVARVLTPRTKAIVVIHTFGIAADTDDFRQFGVPVIEDCCQSFGTLRNGAAVGTVGDLCFFSFHATKCLTTGEGGMVMAGTTEMREKLEDSSEKWKLLSPMSDMEAALGMRQLSHYDRFLARRGEIAGRYFKELPHRFTVRFAEVADRTNFFRFPVTHGGGYEKIAGYCHSRGVGVRRGVDALLHREYGLPDAAFPVAVEMFGMTASLPLYPAMTDEEIQTVCEVMNEVG